MSPIWFCIEILVNLAETGLFVFLINKKHPNKSKSVSPTIIAVLTGTAGLSYIGLGHITWFPDYMVLPIIMAIYTMTARKGSVWQKLFWVVIGTTMIAAAAAIGIAFGLLLPGVTIDIIMLEQSAARIQVLVMCKLLQALFFIFLAVRKELLRFINRTVYMLLILVPVTCILTVALLIEYGLGPAPTITNQYLMVGASMSVLVFNLVVLFLFESLSKQSEESLRIQARLQQNDMITRHNEALIGIYGEMKEWRHDYHNHLQVILGYLQMKKYGRVETYVNEIEARLYSLEMPVNSGNSIIDAILSSKMLMARSQNICTNLEIQIPPDLNIDDLDMCVMLGNLLDNAIGACRKLDPGSKKLINVALRVYKGYLAITVRYPTNGSPRRSGVFLLSYKQHGARIRRIDEIAAKYGGYVSRHHENCALETNVMLPLENLQNNSA